MDQGADDQLGRAADWPQKVVALTALYTPRAGRLTA